MTSKCSSSAACGRTDTDKMASIKRIAVIAAVVLLLSMAVVGAASAATVTYNANGGSGYVPQTYNIADNITISGNVGSLHKSDGSYFAGWNTKADGSGTTYYPGTVVHESLTLYAKWSKTTYAVSVNVDNASDMMFTCSWVGEGTTGTTGTGFTGIQEGSLVTILAADDGSDDVHFAVSSDKWGVTTGNIVLEVKQHNEYSFRLGANNVTINPVEKSAELKVIYNKNTEDAGIEPVDMNYYASGDTASITDDIGSLYRSGYLLREWNTRKDGTGFTYDRGSTFTITGDVTLYAQWVQGYTELEYLQSYGLEYIDTGINCSNLRDVVYLDYEWTGYSGSAFDKVFGCLKDKAGKFIQENYTDNNGQAYTMNNDGGYTGGNQIYFDTNRQTSKLYTTIMYSNRIECNGITYYGNNDTLEFDESYYLFGLNKAGTCIQKSKLKVYKFAIDKDNVRVLNFVPAAKTTSGESVEFGMYDTVSGTFFSNLGSGSFGGGYKVTYNKNGGSSITTATQYGKSGDYITVSAFAGTAPSGKKFSHWNTASNGSGTSYYTGQTLILTGDITLYAQWVDEGTTAYCVSYNENNADGGTVPATQVYAGTQLVISGNSGNLVREGYTFTEWNTKADGTGDKYAFGSTYNGSNGSLILYAKWVPVSYTVRYNANGGSGTMDNQQFNYGEAQTLKANEFTNTGFTFAGWATSAEGDVVYSNEQTVNNLTSTAGGTVDLYAKWTEDNKYTVTYRANGATGGTVPEDSTLHASGDMVTVLGNSGNLIKTGYAFAGWNTAVDGTGTTYQKGGTFEIIGNSILYAKWEDPTTIVTLNKNGGDTDPVPSTVNEKSECMVNGVPFTSAAAKTGYALDGWYTASSGGSKILNANGSAVGNAVDGWVDEDGKWVKTENVATLYARWTPNSYQITYKDQGGSGFTGTHESGYPTTHTYGTATTLKGATKTGYTFGGWFRESYCSGTAVTELGVTEYTDNITLYAKWTPITYTVRYNANGGTGTMTDQEFTYDVAQNLSTNVFIKTGCVFSGWATDEHGSVVYSDEESVSNLTATQGDTVNLYAVWDTITYTFVIPAALTLDGSGTATTADYSITMKSDAVSGDIRKIQMKLTDSANYNAGGYDGFKVKNVDTEMYQDYLIKKDSSTVVKGGEIVSVSVADKTGSGKPVTLTYQLSGSTAYAGTYQDTLTFEVSVDKCVSLALTGGTWECEGTTITSVTVPIGSLISVSGMTVTFTKDSTSVVVTHTASNTTLLIGSSEGIREVKSGTTTVLATDTKIHWGLPSGYTEVDYIESSGTQWINTGLETGTNYLRYDIVCSFTSFGDEHIFGCISGTGKEGGRYFLQAPKSSSENKFRLGYNLVSTGSYNSYTSTNVFYHLCGEMRPGLQTLYVDNNIEVSEVDETSYVNNYPIYLFCSYTYGLGVPSRFLHGQIKKAVFYDSFTGLPLRYFIPCTRGSDNKPGMYDLVTGEFVVNQGTGADFTAGPEVS